MKALTPIVALTSVFMLACCFVVFGACSVGLTEKLGLTDAQWSLIPALFLYTACIVQIFIGAITDKIGHKPVSITGFIVTIASMLLIAYAPNVGMMYVAAVLLGIGAMSLNTVGNTIIPQVLFGGKDPARASNFGNGFFGLGLFCAPLIINYAPSYQTGLLILGVLNVVFLVLALLAKFPSANLGYKFSTALKLLGQSPVLIAALALLCYVGLENSMSNWTAKLMNELYTNAGAVNAAKSSATILSLFGLAMMVGRFIASAVKNLTSIGIKVILVMSAIAAVALLSLYLAKTPAMAVIAVIVTGLAFAPIFPTVVGVTFGKYEPKYYGSIFGIIFAVGLFGGGLLQNLIGAMAGNSVQSGFILLTITAVVLLVIGLLMGKTKAKPVN
ncbi:MFS transporter [candidate division KSB1 bacterium]|nr:MAG: MFS transporter [candidate division KSB1 bacterium]